MISILPRENYEQFVALQRAVKTACGEIPESARENDHSNNYISALNNADKEKEDGDREFPLQLRRSLPVLTGNVRSADVHSMNHNLFNYDRSLEEANSRIHKLTNRRRLTSAASESTVASRCKTRPEAKFQKLATSQILSQMRKESHKIAKDPERFLGGLWDERKGFTEKLPLALQGDRLTSLFEEIDKNANTKQFQSSLEDLQQKCRQSKSRTLLLNLKASPAVIRGRVSQTSSTPNLKSRTPSRSSLGSARSSQSQQSSASRYSAFLNGGGGGGGGDSNASSFEEDVCQLLDYSREDNADIVLQSYLEEIKNANVDNITNWVEAPPQFNDLELPFGLPLSGVLKLPTGNLHELSQTLVDFIKSAVEEFLLLDAEYHAKLEELRVKITDNFRELELAKWQGKDAALLFHLMNLTQQSGAHFSSEKLCTEVATRIFPMYSREDIVAQKYRLKVKKALEEKRDSIIKHWLKDKENLVKRVNAAWEDIQKKEKLLEDFNLEKRRQQEKCQYWTELLEKLRKENRKKVRTIQTLVEPLEEQLRHRQKIKEKLEKNRRLEQKEMIDKFHRLRMETEEDQKKRQEEIQMLLEKDRKIRQIHNRTRVHMRKKEYEMRREQQKELERKREEEKLKRLEILERTKEKIDIKYHPAHVLHDTHASLVRSHEIQNLINLRDGNLEEAVKFFQERYSFSAETLWKDTRVRIESKLREAGLIDNSYARHVLIAMQPKAKPHLQSQIKFDDD